MRSKRQVSTSDIDKDITLWKTQWMPLSTTEVHNVVSSPLVLWEISVEINSLMPVSVTDETMMEEIMVYTNAVDDVIHMFFKGL